MSARGPGTTADELAAALPQSAAGWLAQAQAAVRADPGAVDALFAVAARRCGRAVLRVGPAAGPAWSADDAVRALLLVALPPRGADPAVVAERLYRTGDTAERRAVLRSLPLLDAAGDLGDRGLALVEDAVRSNDPRLIAAALGPYGGRRLAAPAFRQAVLKCVFVGIPLAAVAGLDERADAELGRMMADFADERRAAGRQVPPDVLHHLHTHPAPTEATA
ncbi:EboA domain-containing protein [Streptomyces sp. MB09-02B]|uniref:EboA domain-containing protein n=1 Tax=Streptomyces sp. MB09-02B TaxID=3028667 RepID=UPI0029A67B45|nr:EboA domain-containing protein [Streptomyces sp. MB09-02B]MDX3639646.1 EboA domain-containing protein [Streptomyces sp. MB09-02B]